MPKLLDTMPKLVSRLVFVISALMVAFQLYVAKFGNFDPMSTRVIHLTFVLMLVFLYDLKKDLTQYQKEGSKIKFIKMIITVSLTLLSLMTMGYLLINVDYIYERFSYVTPFTATQSILAVLLIIILLEATRRKMGIVLPLVTVIVVVYGFFGPYLWGILKHGGIKTNVLFELGYLTTDGTFGIPLGVSTSYLFLFILFGSLLNSSGLGQFLMNVIVRFAGNMRGGPAKIAVLSSASMGSISGSAIANVVTTGAITIPLMKKNGYSPHFAAGVEAAASTGGLIMPPIMGVLAFLMIEYASVSYATVMKSAIIPALLYFFAIYISIHFEAIRKGIGGIAIDSEEKLTKQIIGQGHLLLPLIILTALLIGGYSPAFSIFWAIVTIIPTTWLKKKTRMGLQKLAGAITEGVQSALLVGVSTALAGFLAGVLAMTGLPLKITVLMVNMSGHNIWLILLLSALAIVLLGTGIPATVTYIIAVALIVPVMTKLGIQPLVAHFFVMYYASLSFITPPVAIASYAAASIAGANAMKAGLEATKLGIVGFIIPFFFVYNPALLGLGTISAITSSFVSAVFGTILLASAVQGYFAKPLGWLLRALALVGSVVLIIPGLYSDIAGFVIFLFFFFPAIKNLSMPKNLLKVLFKSS